MTKEDYYDVENSTKCWICNVYDDDDVKVRCHCHIAGKYRGSAHRDCNIKVISNHNIPVIFNNLQNYDLHLIMQKLGKFNFKINVTLNGSEKYMSFNINSKLCFIDRIQCLSASLGSSVRNLGRDDFKYFN